MNKILNNSSFVFIIFLLPLFYIIGIAIVELVVFILLFSFVYKNRNFEIFKEKIIIYLLFISIYIFLNALININHFDLLVSSIFHFRYVLLVLSIYFFLDSEKKKVFENKKFIINFVFILIGFVFIDTIFQFLFGYNFFNFHISDYGRVSGVFGEELILGSFLVKYFIIFLWFLFYLEYPIEKNKKLITIFCSLFFICIFLSGGRTSFFLLILITFATIIFIPKLRSIFVKSILSLFLFVILTNYMNFGKTDPINRLINKTFNQITNEHFKGTKKMNHLTETFFPNDNSKQLNIKNIIKNINLFSSDHQGHYILATQLFKDAPVFGKGPEGFRYYCRSVDYSSDLGRCTTHPHNILLQIASELGLVGLFFYSFGLIYLFIKMFLIKKKKINSNLKNCFFISSIGIIVILFPLVPSGNIFNNWFSIMIYYYIGLFIYSFKKCEESY